MIFRDVIEKKIVLICNYLNIEKDFDSFINWIIELRKDLKIPNKLYEVLDEKKLSTQFYPSLVRAIFQTREFEERFLKIGMPYRILGGIKFYERAEIKDCVGYLRLPEKIEEEWEEDYKDHHPANGHIEFLHGSSGRMHTHTFLVKPTVGDFFVFPGDLIHMVYPFKSEGERRSFSMNIALEQRQLDKDGNPIGEPINKDKLSVD